MPRRNAKGERSSRNGVERIIAQPKAILEGEGMRTIRQGRIFISRLNRELLLRVVLERRGDLLLVITAYLTSQFSKYERKAR